MASEYLGDEYKVRSGGGVQQLKYMALETSGGPSYEGERKHAASVFTGHSVYDPEVTAVLLRIANPHGLSAFYHPSRNTLTRNRQFRVE